MHEREPPNANRYGFSGGQIRVCEARFMHDGASRYASDTTEPLLRINDVCRRLAVSRQTVYRLVAAGDLAATRVGTRLRFDPADVRRYVERNREAVAP